MRFWLFIGIIGALCFFSVKTCTNRAQKFLPDAWKSEEAKASEKPSLWKGDKPEASPIHVPLPGQAAPSGSLVAPASVPVHTEIVQFLHRDIPGQDFFAQLGATGVKAVIDQPGRTVGLFGDKDTTVRAAMVLRSLDVLPQSCALRCWAVYVDRRVAKGWDLAAAIGAVLELPDAIEVGGGHFTLDVSAGDLSAALDVVADGSAVEVLQAPHVLLLNREAALVEAIQEVPLPSTVVSQGVSQSSVQYRKVGLQLDVMPEFFAEDRVRLKVSQSNGLIGSNVEVSGSEVPIIETQKVSSSVELTVGQAVVLGGVRTVRERSLKGLLRDKVELSEGALYVVLATGRDAPRAVQLGDNGIPLSPALRSSGHVPFGVEDQAAEDWIDSQLLPPRDWQAEESDFLRRRRNPSK